MITVPIGYNPFPLPHPTNAKALQDLWDSNHVKMPYSKHNMVSNKYSPITMVNFLFFRMNGNRLRLCSPKDFHRNNNWKNRSKDITKTIPN